MSLPLLRRMGGLIFSLALVSFAAPEAFSTQDETVNSESVQEGKIKKPSKKKSNKSKSTEESKNDDSDALPTPKLKRSDSTSSVTINESKLKIKPTSSSKKGATSGKKASLNKTESKEALSELDTRRIEIRDEKGKPVAVIYSYPWSYDLTANGLGELCDKEEVREQVDNLADMLQKSMSKANCFSLIQFYADQLYHCRRILDEYEKKPLFVTVDGKTFKAKADVLKKRVNHLYSGPHDWYQEHMLPGKDRDPIGPAYLELARDVKVSVFKSASFSGQFAIIPLYGGYGYGKKVYIDHQPGTPPSQLNFEQATRTREAIQFALDQMRKLGLKKEKTVDTRLVGNLGNLTQTGQPRISDSMTADDCKAQLQSWLEALPQTKGSQTTSSKAKGSKLKGSKSKEKQNLFSKKKKN